MTYEKRKKEEVNTRVTAIFTHSGMGGSSAGAVESSDEMGVKKNWKFKSATCVRRCEVEEVTFDFYPHSFFHFH